MLMRDEVREWREKTLSEMREVLKCGEIILYL